MKIILNILVVMFILTGCMTNTQTYNIAINKITTTNKSANNNINKNIFNNNLVIPTVANKKKIALLFSSNKIGHYAIDATNTSLAYLLNLKKPFKLKVFDMIKEDQKSFKTTLDDINDQGFTDIVAIITNNSYQNLVKVSNLSRFNIFLPLIHKDNIDEPLKNITFGGVDYDAQFTKLLKQSTNSNINLYDNSSFGIILKNKLNTVDTNIAYEYKVDNTSGLYKRFLVKNNKKFKSSTVILNTPIIKSSILLSQLRANNIFPKKILSTQLNYSPLILSLTQNKDRKNLIVANSIEKVDDNLKESITLLESDISYDWLNFSTLVGINFFIKENNSSIHSKIIDNQVIYNVRLLKAKMHSFLELN